MKVRLTPASIALIILTLLIPFDIVFAQGEYLQPGQSGYSVSGSVSVSNHASAMGLSAGYSYLALIDLSVGLARIRPDDDGDSEGELTAGAVILGSAVHLARQSPCGPPLSLSVQFGIQKDYWSSEMPVHPEGYALWLGTNFTREMHLSRTHRSANYIGLRWVQQSVSTRYAETVGVDPRQSRLLVTLGSAVALVTGQVDKRRISYASSQLVIDPSLTFDTRDGSREFALNISLLIGHEPPHTRW
jgi:hypothetical protein